VERIVIPDSCILLDYMMAQATSLVDRLLVYPEAMRHNLERTRGLVFSQSVLLALTRAGMSREEAYRLVQGAAMETWTTGREFRSVLEEQEAITRLVPADALGQLFDVRRSLRHVDDIFRRAGLA
jgi:adenylosuccinate lyase